MEKRSRRRTRDLVTQPASQGLSQNEIGCVRISMMAKSMNALFTGRIQKRKTNPLHHSHLACNTRPVHTVGSTAASPPRRKRVCFTSKSCRAGRRCYGQFELNFPASAICSKGPHKRSARRCRNDGDFGGVLQRSLLRRPRLRRPRQR